MTSSDAPTSSEETTRGRCERHTEHAIRPGEGLVGRHFDSAGRSYWDWCDTELGEWVECLSHQRVHSTGWCSVGRSNKRRAEEPKATPSEGPKETLSD